MQRSRAWTCRLPMMSSTWACGYGFIQSEKVLGRVAPDARITGVDACDTNRPAFLGTAERSEHRGDFGSLRLTEELPWPDKSFDSRLPLHTPSTSFSPA
ncbi:MAG: class I SAM-dependent methyltransferase [Desulfobacterales bacterium]|nr:class I SAM-dependent methyltransferase [Desulfobacterales bacterium]